VARFRLVSSNRHLTSICVILTSRFWAACSCPVSKSAAAWMKPQKNKVTTALLHLKNRYITFSKQTAFSLRLHQNFMHKKQSYVRQQPELELNINGGKAQNMLTTKTNFVKLTYWPRTSRLCGRRLITSSYNFKLTAYLFCVKVFDASAHTWWAFPLVILPALFIKQRVW